MMNSFQNFDIAQINDNPIIYDRQGLKKRKKKKEKEKERKKKNRKCLIEIIIIKFKSNF